MKILDRILIVIFNLLLILTVIIISALKIAQTPNWYLNAFEKNGLYHLNQDGEKVADVPYFGGHYLSDAELTYEQTEIIANHISNYLFSDNEDDFYLEFESVIVNGQNVNNAAVFSNDAVKHMADVKALIKSVIIICSVFIILLVLIAVYMLVRRKFLRKLLLKYSLCFFAGIVLLFGAFFSWCLIDVVSAGQQLTSEVFFSELWENMHTLFFPFQPERIEGSFFNDTLTSILSLDFFMDAVLNVLVILISVIVIWMIICIYQRIKKERN